MALSMFTACGAGVDGLNGKDGKDGKDGIAPQVKIGEDDYWYVSYDSGTTWQSLNVKATGKDGADGEKGETGPKGETGARGETGSKGDVGNPTFIWVKYADAMPTSNEELKDTVSDYMGVYNGESKDAPTDYTAYQWIQIVADAPEPVEEDFTVLAIGSSYLNKENAMTHIYEMASSVGITNIKLGNIYKGGVKMSANYSSLKNNSATYTYYENDSGEWVKTHDGDYSINAALTERDWDYIIINQGLIQAGLKDEYACLEEYLALIRQYCPNAKIFFSMSWAYPEGSTGMDPADVPYVPTKSNGTISQIDPSLPTTVTPELQQLAIECVRNALAQPFWITAFSVK